jgi:hypothetical protein
MAFSGSRESHVRFLMSHWMTGEFFIPLSGTEEKTNLSSTEKWEIN